MRIWLIYMGILLYWEVIYHFGIFGFVAGYPWMTIGLLAIVASIQAIITGCVNKKHKRKSFWILVLPEYLIFGVQTVYYTIFRQPLQIQAMLMGGEDALSQYWREALVGFLKALPMLLLLAVPLFVAWYWLYRRKWKFPVFQSIQVIRTVFVMGVSFLAYWMVLEFSEIADADYYHEYKEFYDPTIVMQNVGVITMVQRDISYEMEMLADEMFLTLDPGADNKSDGDSEDLMAESSRENGAEDIVQDPSGIEETVEEETPGSEEDSDEGENESTTSSDENLEEENPSGSEADDENVYPELHCMEFDLEKLVALSAGNKEKEWLADYFSSVNSTKTNEYTGMFKDHNLIYITAEGFSTYAINAELTPTLYKLANSGFVFSNYYVPLWQTSTSDGEYVNLTGLIPDGQFSLRKSKENCMAYSLPGFFGPEGYVNKAYHNNTMDYYVRHLTHPNLGYDFKASKLGDLSEEEWGDKIFYMENPDRWPASDLEMIQYTLPEYIQEERFHVYYMTVSGHMNYSFRGNSMSSKNKEAVAGLDMSENARAYIACHIELDKALEHLLAELEKAGKLKSTVIVMSADHYPYGMSAEQYEELAGKDLSKNRDTYRNSLILYNAGMAESVPVTKPCCSVDILPTLLNLFGFDYDSRMYAGRDILSDEEGLVIFNDRSFVTDKVVYDRKEKTTSWKVDMSTEEQEAYMSAMKQEVKDRYEFSAYILRQDYYDVLKQCEVIEE